MKNLREKFLKSKEVFESKWLKTKVMVSGSKQEILKSKVDPCTKCSQRVMANSELHTKCGKWLYGIQMYQNEESDFDSGKRFVCERCVKAMKRTVKTAKELTFYDHVELVKSFCYLGYRLNATGGSEVVVTVKTRIGWIKFRRYKILLNGSFY